MTHYNAVCLNNTECAVGVQYHVLMCWFVLVSFFDFLYFRPGSSEYSLVLFGIWRLYVIQTGLFKALDARLLMKRANK